MAATSTPVVRAGVATLMVHEAHAEAAISAYYQATAPQTVTPQAFDRTLGDKQEDAPHGSYRVAKAGTGAGVALVPVLGTLIPRGLFMGSGYATAYEALGAEMRRAAADPAVSEIALLIDSPGGYVSGIDAAAAAIRAADAVKPVTAYVQGMACSAAYWLACACREIVCSPLAELGSIGVLQAHFDVSRLFEEMGVKVTLLHAGAKKVDGNMYEPLPDRVKAEMNQELEDLRMAFATAVAAGRPSLDVAAVLATEAATYRGPAAVARGLADRVGLIADDLPDSDDPALTSPFGRFQLSLNEDHAMITQAQLDEQLAAAKTAAKAEGHTLGKTEGHALGKVEGHQAGLVEGHAAGLAEGKAEAAAAATDAGASAERQRIAAIRGSDEAKKRPAAAEHVAMTTAMPLAEAKSFLAGLPEEKAVATLDAEMDRDRVPLVGADGKPLQANLSGEEQKFAEGKATAEKLLGKVPAGK